MVDLDTDIFAAIFQDEGAVALGWEQSSRCSCYSIDSRQPLWGCPLCGGSGVLFAATVTILGLFRARSQWMSFRREGEFVHGEAELTTPLNVRPGYTDRRVRDRFTTIPASTDAAEGKVFMAAAGAVPFIFNDIQRAWRVQLQSTDLEQQLNP